MHSSDEAQPDVSARLRQLVGRGFQLMPPLRDTAGEIEALVYVRPKGGIIDIVELLAEDDVRAARVPRRGELSTDTNAAFWRTFGDVRQVIDEVLALPEPLVRV